MTSSSLPNPSGARPLTPNDDRRKKRPLWWLLAVLAALVIAAVIIALIVANRHHTSTAANSVTNSPLATPPASSTPSAADSTSATSASTAGNPASSSAPAAATGAGAGAGTLTANGTALLPAPADSNNDLTAYAGKPATASGVLVLSAPVDNGFWIGTSTADEVWVQLLLPGLVTPHPVRQGDHVSFPAAVVANPAGFAATAGLTDATGAARLTAQKSHLEVTKNDVQFTN